jgi:hypothetical protein
MSHTCILKNKIQLRSKERWSSIPSRRRHCRRDFSFEKNGHLTGDFVFWLPRRNWTSWYIQATNDAIVCSDSVVPAPKNKATPKVPGAKEIALRNPYCHPVLRRPLSEPTLKCWWHHTACHHCRMQPGITSHRVTTSTTITFRILNICNLDPLTSPRAVSQIASSDSPWVRFRKSGIRTPAAA